jgi:SAM-dependent methyltransferase
MVSLATKFANRISGQNRARKYQYFISQFCPTATSKILDVGYTNKETSSYSNYLEKHYPYPEKICALGIQPPKEFPENYPKVKAVQYNGKVFPFADKEFDIVWSNAVIEHVGGYERQLLFLKEMLRVGKQIYFTTPNRFFPVEVHSKILFFHWLPEHYFGFIANKLKHSWKKVMQIHLLSKGDIQRLLSDAGVKEYVITCNKKYLFTMDFSIVIKSYI